MKPIFVVALAMMSLSTAVFAGQETCYQVSPNGESWSRTPESLCIAQGNDDKYVITLKSGMPFAGQEQEVAKFNLSLLKRVRCIDCNGDVYGVANPSNSTFNALSIQFTGTIERGTRNESGTVSIGQTKLFYRSER